MSCVIEFSPLPFNYSASCIEARWLDTGLLRGGGSGLSYIKVSYDSRTKFEIIFVYTYGSLSREVVGLVAGVLWQDVLIIEKVIVAKIGVKLRILVIPIRITASAKSTLSIHKL